MIRLPPTGITIAQHDVSFHLQQLDIYQGLLKQGFKKEEVVGYLREQKSNKQKTRTTSLLPEPGPAPSTVSLCDRTSIRLVSTLTDPLARGESSGDAAGSSPSGTGSSVDDQSDPTLSDDSATLPSIRHSPASRARYEDVKGRPHAPRQSSQLRFAKGVSSDSPRNGNRNVRALFSPRSITYRPRSKTYSYDQSAVDEEDQEEIEASLNLSDNLEHLSLDNELVPSGEPIGASARIGSHLRPEAVVFTPLLVQLTRTAESNDRTEDKSHGNSNTKAFSSSPPQTVLHGLDVPEPSPPTLPPVPTTPTLRADQDPQTARRQHLGHQQYLDGSFTVYDDSLPPSVQPQTPADLERGPHFNSLNAAYTAPPGMVRSGAHRHTIRHVYGEQSPTARAMLIRERRQREFMRSARLESLRVDRARDGVNNGLVVNNNEQRNGRGRDNVGNNLWREGLDADAIGEENFDDGAFAAEFQAGMRVFSGNRRVT
ncbi:hypothetical protein H2198_005322 [Neophaeococcomyces mojaviensis]|uniref:Uncharacterized protein n=1 Tax=Neophaeococcomyces mojaviensis TaxID=3383035 RepID=A0ACC3A5Z8_9EURO|nr:hypothetical protein H2198_005322 [Knufia sp. JES_112]